MDELKKLIEKYKLNTLTYYTFDIEAIFEKEALHKIFDLNTPFHTITFALVYSNFDNSRSYSATNLRMEYPTKNGTQLKLARRLVKLYTTGPVYVWSRDLESKTIDFWINNVKGLSKNDKVKLKRFKDNIIDLQSFFGELNKTKIILPWDKTKLKLDTIWSEWKNIDLDSVKDLGGRKCSSVGFKLAKKIKKNGENVDKIWLKENIDRILEHNINDTEKIDWLIKEIKKIKSVNLLKEENSNG